MLKEMKTGRIVGMFYIAIAIAFVFWKRDAMFSYSHNFIFYTRWLLALAMTVLGIIRFRQNPGQRGEQY